MGQATDRSSKDTLDLVITNALIVDWSGIYKVQFPTPYLQSALHSTDPNIHAPTPPA